ncbi:MAG: xylG [Fibrobacteres bacterium]|nr:xylG [Fibrobacterota bacterium]
MALAGVDLSLRRSEVHALCGENGAGKSTLLKILAGCHPHGSYGGELMGESGPLKMHSPADADAAGIALVAQELALVPELSIFENMFLGRELSRFGLLRKPEMQRRCELALQRVGLDERPETIVSSLSVGRQQLVEIAKALDKEARVLILDEPTAALTASDAERLNALVRTLVDQGVGCLYVSHRLEEVFSISDTITVLRDGKTVKTGPASGWNRASVVEAMVGRALAEDAMHAPAPMKGTAAPALAVEHWSLTHPSIPGRFAVEDLGFELHPGEILGVAGLMGSGRTALLTSLFGAARSRITGRLRRGDGEWRDPFHDPREAMAAGLALVSEDRKGQGLVLNASLNENIALATLTEYQRRGFLDWAALRKRAASIAASLQVKAANLEVEAGSLSGGNQQKIVLAKWLETGPSILLLDEPTRGIDVGSKAEIHALIRDLAAKGMSVLVASSDLSELLGLSHRLMVMSAGRQTALLERDQFSQVAVMHAATAG